MKIAGASFCGIHSGVLAQPTSGVMFTLSFPTLPLAP